MTTCVQEYNEPVRAAVAAGEDAPRARPGAARKGDTHGPRTKALLEMAGKARQALWLANGCFYNGHGNANASRAGRVPKYLGR